MYKDEVIKLSENATSIKKALLTMEKTMSKQSFLVISIAA